MATQPCDCVIRFKLDDALTLLSEANHSPDADKTERAVDERLLGHDNRVTSSWAFGNCHHIDAQSKVQCVCNFRGG